jgi:hypothetical protein
METIMANDPNADWTAWALKNSARMEAPATSFTPAPTTTVTAQAPFSAGFSAPSFDVIDRLASAPAAAEKLRVQRDRCSEKRAAMIPHSELQEVIAERTLAEQNHGRLLAHAQDGGFGLPPTDASVAAAAQLVARTNANARRVQERSEKLAAAWLAASQPLAACESFLRDGLPSGVQLLDYDGPEPPALLKNETLLDGIARLQRRTRELRADIHRVHSACYTKAEAMALVNATVENWGSNGIDTSVTIEHLSRPTIPTTMVQAMVHNVPGAPAAVVYVDVPDVAAILSTVLKDQFIAWLAADVDRNADPKGALSREAREQQEAVVMSDLLATERDLSSLIWRGQAEGLQVEFGEINPVAILGLKLVTAPRADPSPETSPGYSWPMRR